MENPSGEPEELSCSLRHNPRQAHGLPGLGPAQVVGCLAEWVGVRWGQLPWGFQGEAGAGCCVTGCKVGPRFDAVTVEGVPVSNGRAVDFQLEGGQLLLTEGHRRGSRHALELQDRVLLLSKSAPLLHASDLRFYVKWRVVSSTF